MARRGPKPTPRNLRLVKGTDRPDRMNESEPVVPVSVPDAPSHLNPDEQRIFTEQAEILAKMRVMTEADVKALSIFARAWKESLDMHDQMIKSGGIIVQAPRTKVPMFNPYKKARDDAEKKAIAILTEFGLTPSSRTRVKST